SRRLVLFLLLVHSSRTGSFFFFFFQAEDGIRCRNVTGVQTCALPISNSGTVKNMYSVKVNEQISNRTQILGPNIRSSSGKVENRSEERRVGKECRTRWSPDE